MILFGASGHAKVIISCLNDLSIGVEAIFDDDPSTINLGPYTISGLYNPALFRDQKLIIAVGDNNIRQRISVRIMHDFGIVVHPSALIDQSVAIGEGTVIIHRSVIQAGTTIGNHVIINTMASIDHDCIVEDFVHIAPGAIICGGVFIGEKTLVGVGSVVTPNITIGRNCLITAGSVVTQNIPDDSVVRGNPARIVNLHNS